MAACRSEWQDVLFGLGMLYLANLALVPHRVRLRE
jgi:hypothetical protein